MRLIHLLLALLWVTPAAAQTPPTDTVYMSGLSAATALSDTDQFYVCQDASTHCPHNGTLITEFTGTQLTTYFRSKLSATSPALFNPSTGVISLGNIPVTNLNGGTGASSTTFWRGDATWATPVAVAAGNTIDASLSSGADMCAKLSAAAVTAYNGGAPIANTIDARGFAAGNQTCAGSMFAAWQGGSPSIPHGINFPVNYLWGTSLINSTVYQLRPPGITFTMTAPNQGTPYVVTEVPLVAPAVTANAYYVSNGSYGLTLGADTNAGTVTAPFLSVDKCVAAMTASGSNKTCYIRAGTYNGFASACTTHSNTTVDGCSVDIRKGGATVGSSVFGAAGTGLTGQTIASFASASSFILNTAAGASGTGKTWFSSNFFSGDLITMNQGAGQTLSYYPPDGIGTAIFDGGGTTAADNIGTALEMADFDNLTVNGLQFANFGHAAITINNGGSAHSNNVVINNVVHDIFTPLENGEAAIRAGGNPISPLIANNYVYNTTSNAIACNSLSLQSPTNCTIAGNYIYNACSADNDCGLIYTQDNLNGIPNSTGMTIANNYIVGTYAGGSVGSVDIYFDDGKSNGYVYSNIMAGLCRYCAQIHGGQNVTFYGNLIDLGNAPAAIPLYNQQTAGLTNANTNGTTAAGNATLHFAAAPVCSGGWCQNWIVTDTTTPSAIPAGTTITSATSTATPIMSANAAGGGVGNGDTILFQPPMTGNVWQNNLIIANQASPAGGGYTGDATAPASPAISNNFYYNFGTGGFVNYLGTNATNTDSAPRSGPPGFLPGCTYTLEPGSPAFGSPVNFPVLPSRWGPPGFVPHFVNPTGPSYLTGTGCP